jgi:hypothetical protein
MVFPKQHRKAGVSRSQTDAKPTLIADNTLSAKECQWV